MNLEERRKRRVVASHRIAVTAFRLAAVFAIGAVAWAVWVLARGGSWWGPIHTFLLGTATLAIAGATQLFTITWSAAPAPLASMAAAPRWLQAAGAVTVLGGITIGNHGAVLAGGVAVIAGVGVLASSLVGAVRHSLLRRFDLSARFYLLAIGCAVVGVSLGVVMGMELTGSIYSRIRVVHGRLNLIGFIGFTIIGTLPTILPTFVHHRAVSGREAVVAWRLAIAAAAVMAAGLVLGEVAAGVGVILAAGSLVTMVGGVVLRLRGTGLRGGLPYFQVVIGSAWLAAWALVDGTRLLVGSVVAPFDRWTAAAVIAGVGQVLLGSLAYLIPVLLGAGPHLGQHFERLHRHAWLPLAAANGAALALLAGLPPVTVVLLAVWVADFARRVVGLMLARSRVDSATSGG